MERLDKNTKSMQKPKKTYRNQQKKVTQCDKKASKTQKNTINKTPPQKFQLFAKK